MKVAKNEVKDMLRIIFISTLPVIAVYLPFVLHLKHFWGIPLGDSGMNVIFANWDGPNYVYNAITNYAPAEIAARPFLNVAAYYPAHFPALSWLISPLSLFLGYFWGSIFLQLLSGFLLNVGFYVFIKVRSKHALWLTFAFTVFPPRYLVVRSVIGPEMFLVALVIAALWAWENKRYYYASLIVFVAIFFKFQALALPLTFVLLIALDIYERKHVKIAKLLPVLSGLFGYFLVSLYYLVQTGNFMAYFEAQRIVGMSAAIPFAMFNYAQKWVGTGWMEAAALYFAAIFVMIATLIKEKKIVFAAFGIAYTLLLTMIPQVDIMRIAIPLSPIFFYTFHEFLSSKPFRWGLIASIPAIYLFTINFIVKNQAPIIDWSYFR